MPIEYTEALAMRRENFNEVMEDPFAKKLEPVIAKIYNYVNIGAYGIGKVTVDADGNAGYDDESSDSEEANFDDIEDNEKRLYYKLKNF